MTNKYENNIIDAIETIVDNAVANAGYDKTIKATIVECVDQTIGKFKVKYQDSVFFAYATSSEVTYTRGAEVYILIPGNDTSRDKTILGTVKKLGADYAVTPEGDEAFEPVGNNILHSSSTFELCSYKTTYKTTEKILYQRGGSNNQISLDETAATRYFTKSSALICGAIFKTTIPGQQQYRGNYGISFELMFTDNATGKDVLRNYVLDVNQMTGNPYSIKNETRQYGVFDIDGANFQYVNKISLFCYDFPYQEDNQPNDIFIKDIDFCGAVPMGSEALSGCALTFITPQGIYFDNTDEETASRDLQAQVRVKGKVIDKNSQMLEYYWFRENIGVTEQHIKYHKYAGAGWECLNEYSMIDLAAKRLSWNTSANHYVVNKNIVGDNIIYVDTKSQMTDTTKNYVVLTDGHWYKYGLVITDKGEVYQWIDKGFYHPSATAKNTKYKCVVVYNENTVISKEIEIINYASNINITIESDAGTKFYYDIGRPTIAVKVNGTERNDLTYMWAEVDNNNNFTSLPETTALNSDYNTTKSNYDTLVAQINAETEMAAANQSTLDNYSNHLKEYETIQRVEKGRIYKIDVSQITNFKTFKVSVFSNGIYQGTASIVLTNSYEKENGYTLNIDGGVQVFNYNAAGISPTHESALNPLTIVPLAISLYDNLGNKISDDVLRTCDIKWTIPKKNTMLSVNNSVYSGYKVAETDESITYGRVNGDVLLGLSYDIVNKYNIRNSNNDIKLSVNYKGMVLETTTNFTFTKDGEPGTNGTEFVIKLVPNTRDNKVLENLIVVNGSPTFDRPEGQSNNWVRAQLWHNGERIFNGIQSDISEENKPVTLVWSILKNTYSSSISDNSSFNINKTTGVISGYAFSLDHPANIIQCELLYDKVKYYGTIPVITAIANSGYNIKLKDGSGFKFATYSADGRKASYDNTNPFELIVTEQINGYTEDISRLTGSYAVDYTWNTYGQYWGENSETHQMDWIAANHLIETTRTGLERNQKDYKPSDAYDDESVNNAIGCIIKRDDVELAKIHIPIHLLLNRFGNSAINDWNGNSVQIDEEGGTILSPQVGAGTKDSNNRFTGIVMGAAKEANATKAAVGMFGYDRGQRTLFLNAENGAAIFGKLGSDKGSGQIIIDPTQDKALLYSYDFWKPNLYQENGLVNSSAYAYNSTNNKYAGQNDKGMLIDLTTPRIIFGSGNFRVDPDGHIHAKGGGDIAGWYMDDHNLWSGNTNKDNAATIRFGNENFTRTINGDSRSNLRLALGQKFAVSSDGTMYAGDAKIGTGTNKITIGKSSGDNAQSALYSGSKSSFVAAANGFYIGNDGIALGTYDSNKGTSPFQVNSSGQLFSRSGYIGGYAISDNTLIGGSGSNCVGMSSKSGVQWAFWAGSETAGNAPFHVGHNGALYATKGEIGGWTIGEHQLSGGKMKINDEGSISGNHWGITKDGYATFSDVYISNTHSSLSDKSKLLDFSSFYVQKNGFMHASDADIEGKITATSGSIAGDLVTSGINASNITSGRLNISDGSGHYLRMGFREGDNPFVSGLNVGRYGIICDASIEFKGNLRILNDKGSLLYTGKPAKGGDHLTKQFSWTDRDGKLISLYFCRGLLVDFAES